MQSRASISNWSAHNTHSRRRESFPRNDSYPKDIRKELSGKIWLNRVDHRRTRADHPSVWMEKNQPRLKNEEEATLNVVTLSVSCPSLWEIENRERLTPLQSAHITVLEHQLKECVERFDFGEVMEENTIFLSLILDKELRVNITAYDGNMTDLYLTFFSDDNIIRQDFLPFSNAITGIRKVCKSLAVSK